MGQHLLRQGPRELDDLAVAGLRQQPRAAVDAALAVQVPVRKAGQAGLELVRAPSDERQVRVAVDEPREDRTLRLVSGEVPRFPRQACGRPGVADRSIAPGDGGVSDHFEAPQVLAATRRGSFRRNQDRREEQPFAQWFQLRAQGRFADINGRLPAI